MIKRLGKQIVLRSKMKDIYNKKRTQENLNSWKKQRNFSVNPLRKTKNDCFSNLSLTICLITENSGKRLNLALVITYLPTLKLTKYGQ